MGTNLALVCPQHLQREHLLRDEVNGSLHLTTNKSIEGREGARRVQGQRAQGAQLRQASRAGTGFTPGPPHKTALESHR